MRTLDMTPVGTGAEGQFKYHVVFYEPANGTSNTEFERICLIRDTPISDPKDVEEIEIAYSKKWSGPKSRILFSWQRYETT